MVCLNYPRHISLNIDPYQILLKLWSGFIISTLMVGFSSDLVAQVTITGKVKTEKEKPVPYANVLLLALQDSSMVIGTNTNEKGNFNLAAQPDEYILQITNMGYQAYHKEITIADEKDRLTLNPVVLAKDVKQLEEVEVKGRQYTVEKRADRMVINVQSMVSSAGSSVLEVLAKSPGVTVNRQSNTITIQGKSGVSVMFDGKENPQPLSAVVQMLESMSANNTEKIEIITSPPAKYDAEGNAGMINIVRKDNPNQGTNGNYGLNVAYDRRETFAGNINLNHRNHPLNVFMNYSIRYNKSIHYLIHERSLNVNGHLRSVSSNQDKYVSILNQNLRGGLEYQLSDKTMASLLLSGFNRRKDPDRQTTIFNSVTPDSTIRANMDVDGLNTPWSIQGSLGLSHRWNKDAIIKIFFDYIQRKGASTQKYITRQFYDNDIFHNNQMVYERKEPVNFNVGKMDFSKQINDQLSLETGIKTTLSTFVNNQTLWEGGQNNMEIVNAFSRYSTLDENIFAAYVSWQWNPHQKWEIDGGLRFEQTINQLDTARIGDSIKRNYGNFFPNLSFTRNIKKQSNLNFAYTRRINRPTISDFVPYSYFFGPDAFFGVNFSIQPGISDNFDLSYQLKQWWISLNYGYTSQKIARDQPEINHNTNAIIYRTQNLAYQETYSLNTNIPVQQITPWWDLQNSIGFYLYEYKTSNLENNLVENPFNLTFNATNTFKLPGDFNIEVSGNYQSNRVSGITHFKPWGYLNMSVSKKFKNNNGELTLSLFDMLDTTPFRTETQVPEADINSSFTYDGWSRSIKLSYTKSFGNRELNKVDINSGSKEEQNRVR